MFRISRRIRPRGDGAKISGRLLPTRKHYLNLGIRGSLDPNVTGYLIAAIPRWGDFSVRCNYRAKVPHQAK